MSFDNIRKKFVEHCSRSGIDSTTVEQFFENGELGKRLREWSERYDIQANHVIMVLDDAKVIPMIRGKVTEIVVYERLRRVLDPTVWNVTKPNINPQPNKLDQDILIIHRQKDMKFVIEVKNATRGSLRVERRTSNLCLNIKCHKSRSNKKRPHTNDRYLIGEFDFVVSNMSNALLQNGRYELIDKQEVVNSVTTHYQVDTMYEAMQCALDDMRFARAEDLKDELNLNTIKHQPKLNLSESNVWRPINHIKDELDARIRAMTE